MKFDLTSYGTSNIGYMMINRQSAILLLGLFLAHWSFGCTDDVGPGLSYLRAKQHAEMLDMKYVLYFRAEWSAPCHWVEDYTLSDSLVQSATDNQFIFVQLDIDEFEGYALKNYFQVHTLPTTLVFNSNHDLVNRQEGAISAIALLDLVDRDNQHLRVARDSLNEVINARPFPALSERSVVDENPNPRDTFALPSALVEEVSSYKIQLGVFSSIDNARTIKEKASKLVTAPVVISTEKSGEGLLYRVYAGKTQELEDIEKLLEALSFYGFTGFVKTVIDGTKS